MSTKRVLFIIAALVLLALSVAPTLAAAPGLRTATIQLASDVENPDNQTFVASGPGICRSGWADGQDITYIEFGEAFKIRLTKWLHCDDGSGDIQIELSAGRPADVTPTLSGGWIIIAGTGAYETAVGGGTMSAKLRSPNDTFVLDTMTGMITK